MSKKSSELHNFSERGSTRYIFREAVKKASHELSDHIFLGEIFLELQKSYFFFLVARPLKRAFCGFPKQYNQLYRKLAFFSRTVSTISQVIVMLVIFFMFPTY